MNKPLPVVASDLTDARCLMNERSVVKTAEPREAEGERRKSGCRDEAA